MAARPPPPPQKALPPAQRFKVEIDKLTEEGAAPADLLLRLTRGDAAKLRRDPAVSLDDLSFADGEMRYLGVKVSEGGTDASVLVVSEA